MGGVTESRTILNTPWLCPLLKTPGARMDRKMGVYRSPVEKISALPWTEFQFQDRSSHLIIILAELFGLSEGEIKTR